MKRFKTKKKVNKKNAIILIISMIVFVFFFIWISMHNLNSDNTKFISFLLGNFDNTHKKGLIIKNLTTNLDYLVKTSSFLSEEKTVYNEYNPLVYIYNTHDTEKYIDSKTVVDATAALSNNLKKVGITSLIEERLPSSYSSMGLGLYDISKSFLLDTKDKYPNIMYFIDIHRDSVKNTTIVINNKKYAKILFVLGLDNPKYKENKMVLEKMNEYLNKNFPGISKGILEKKGEGVDGIYNQDIDKNVLLIEIGGIENSFEEVNNSTEIISLMLYNMLGDKGEKVS